MTEGPCARVKPVGSYNSPRSARVRRARPNSYQVSLGSFSLELEDSWKEIAVETRTSSSASVTKRIKGY